MSPQRIMTFKNANTPAPMKLHKPKLIKIQLTEEQKQEIKYILNGDPPKKVRDRYEERWITDVKLMKYHPGSKRSRIESVRKIFTGIIETVTIIIVAIPLRILLIV